MDEDELEIQTFIIRELILPAIYYLIPKKLRASDKFYKEIQKINIENELDFWREMMLLKLAENSNPEEQKTEEQK